MADQQDAMWEEKKRKAMMMNKGDAISEEDRIAYRGIWVRGCLCMRGWVSACSRLWRVMRLVVRERELRRELGV